MKSRRTQVIGYQRKPLTTQLLKRCLGSGTVALICFSDQSVQDPLGFVLRTMHRSTYLATTPCYGVSPGFKPEFPHTWTLKSEPASHGQNDSVESGSRGIYVGFLPLDSLLFLQKPYNYW
jgi:hypothetical protein